MFDVIEILNLKKKKKKTHTHTHTLKKKSLMIFSLIIIGLFIEKKKDNNN